MSVLVRVFFFSSRRRHTRLQGDWSSDVCSSDLQQLLDLGHVIPHRQYIGDDKQRADQQHQQEHPQLEHKPHQPAPCKWLALDSCNGNWFFNMAGVGNGIFSLMSNSLCVSSRSEEHTSELQSPCNLVCRLLLE